jgi:hypothetical protein
MKFPPCWNDPWREPEEWVAMDKLRGVEVDAGRWILEPVIEAWVATGDVDA